MAKNWAIAIGINKYYNLQPLNYAKRDAEAMPDWCQKEAGFDRVFLFTEDSPEIPASPSPIPTQPTYGNLRRFLRANFEKPLLASGDNLWFFFAGHGRREADRDYLMLIDSDPGGVEHTAISVDFITQRLRRSGADNVVLFLDACRNEGDRDGLGIGAEHQGVVTFYSCSPREKAYEIEALEQGSFTHCLLEALRIQGEGNCATVERLYQHLRYQVPQLNIRYKKPRQHPYTIAEPATKLHLILLPKQATLTDVTTLKNDALLPRCGHRDRLLGFSCCVCCCVDFLALDTFALLPFLLLSFALYKRSGAERSKKFFKIKRETIQLFCTFTPLDVKIRLFV